MAYPPEVITDMQSGIDVPTVSRLYAGQRLYRFSSSHQFDKGFFVSPWWMDTSTLELVVGPDPWATGTERTGARARGALAVPPNWKGRNDMNTLDVLVKVTLRRSVVAFRGPGRDQYSSGGKIVRAPRGVIQIYIPELSGKMTPTPTLQTAFELFAPREALHL